MQEVCIRSGKRLLFGGVQKGRRFLERDVYQLDSNAFVIVTDAKESFGEDSS